MAGDDVAAQSSAEITELLDTIERRERRARWRSVLLVTVPAVAAALLVT